MSLSVVTSATFNQAQFWKDPTSPNSSLSSSSPSPSSPSSSSSSSFPFKKNKRKKKSKLILHPIDRMVHDKLTLLTTADDTTDHDTQILNYLHFLQLELPKYSHSHAPPQAQSYPSNSSNNNNQNNSPSIQKYINVQTQKSSSTFLHICALYNHVQGTKVAIYNGANLFVKDDDGCTALDVAKMVGSEGVVQILELEMSKIEEKSEEKEEGEYVFDVYCLQEEEEEEEDKDESNDDPKEEKKGKIEKCIDGVVTPSSFATSTNIKQEQQNNESNKTNNNAPQQKNESTEQPTKIQLRNTIGYFDEHGKLVLEPSSSSTNNDDDKMTNSDNEDRLQEDEYDSNHEDYDGNDYPEEEEEEENDDYYDEEENSMYHDNYQHAFYNKSYSNSNNTTSKNKHHTKNNNNNSYYDGGGNISGAVVGGESWKYYSSYYDVDSYEHGKMSGGSGSMDADCYSSSDEEEDEKMDFRRRLVNYSSRYSVPNIEHDDDDDELGEYRGRMYGSKKRENQEENDDCALNQYAYDAALDMDHDDDENNEAGY